ncbi:MAG: hypothetical protein QS99_C0004G0026 [archaeon GW2011_AR4]|nr:MAG: hypothetical protein QS99_C0004G0026 [archaeon GW2011_AR4]
MCINHDSCSILEKIQSSLAKSSIPLNHYKTHSFIRVIGSLNVLRKCKQPWEVEVDDLSIYFDNLVPILSGITQMPKIFITWNRENCKPPYWQILTSSNLCHFFSKKITIM